MLYFCQFHFWLDPDPRRATSLRSCADPDPKHWLWDNKRYMYLYRTVHIVTSIVLCGIAINFYTSDTLLKWMQIEG
jgi:hypothetical protein